jgi:hypothetical protein
MTQNQNNINVVGYSKFTRIALTIISMLLIFAGPTYVPYIMTEISINYFASIGVGAILFVVGIVMMLYLVQKKVIIS